MYFLAIKPKFVQSLSKFVSDHPDSKQKIIKTLSTLITDVDHPSLRTHKLEGEEVWSISLDMEYRILIKIENAQIIPISIGNHDRIYN